MKIKKFLSLLLSIIYLNLSINFTSCFGMVSNDYSVTVVTLPGYTNCPKCGAQRSSKIDIHGYYVSTCLGCGSRAYLNDDDAKLVGAKRSRNAPKSNNILSSCRYCGCRNFARNGKTKKGFQKYKCSNCNIGGQSYLKQKTELQSWKAGFCKDCNKLDGLVRSKLIAGTRDPRTNNYIRKKDKVKGILSNSNGFSYYCYTCKKWKNITLTKEQAEVVCAEYDRCLKLSNLDV